MAARRPPHGLRGRRRECAELDDLLAGLRAGGSQVLVLRGEPGIGKSALLAYAEEQATGCRVARTAGVESEMELPFAGLHQLCAPFLDGLDRLPAPQRDALGTAFGIVAGDAPDVLFVGLAVLGLLSDAADRQPLVCLVDDSQWLDRASAQVLAFVARRLLADHVAMVFVVREPARSRDLDGLPDLVIRGLADGDAAALLDAAVPGRLDAQVRARIVAETRGNPLAMLELTRDMTPAQLAGGFGAASAGPLSSRVEEAFERRLRALPEDGQTLLRVAASEPVGDVALLWRAAAGLGIDRDAAAAVEAAGLLELGAQVRFPHPLVRSAVYRGATPGDRRAAHGALAEATDGESDPDRRAWHRAHAAVGPDESVAAELERSAGRARRRGGAAAAAAFLQRATELTPDIARRGERALAAAHAALDAAAPGVATRLLAEAAAAPLDERRQASAVRLRARIAFAERRGSDAPPLLLDAAHRLGPLDPQLARDTYLDALEAAIFAGRLAGTPSLRDVAEAARRSPPPSDRSPRVVDLLVAGLATRFTDGYVAAVAPLRLVLDAMRADAPHGIGGSSGSVGGGGDAGIQRLWMGCRVASELWDDETWAELATRQLKLARDAGAIGALPFAVTYRAGVHIHAGEFGAASALVAEARSLTSAVGGAPLLYTTLVLAAWRGEEDHLAQELAWGIPDATARGEGRGLAWGAYATALLHNGLGHYRAALPAAQAASGHDDLGIVNWALVELVEAAVRSGEGGIAADALDRLSQRAAASGTEWALGIAACSRALLADRAAADDLYREAVERLARTRVPVHLARAQLLYGEWLRRENRRVDARHQLRAAHELFVRFGAEGFAERARRELVATGETVRKRTVDAVDSLTAQEAQIARLACDGFTNPEIGSQLFISPRTVEYHLRKVFTKLAVSSRRELRTALPDVAHHRSPA